MNKIKITERGWAGHFICASDCGFRRNTLIDNENKKIVVSTVGAYRLRGKIEKIGLDRYYETMAFEADDSIYNDADVSKQVYADSKWAIGKDEIKLEGVDNIADQMHESYVAAIVKMLKKGEL